MTTLNDTFERELTQEDEGYESRSESFSIPTPLRRALQIYHISTSENLSFDPTTPLTTAEQHWEHSPWRFRRCSSICCHLVFTSSDDESPIRTSDPCLWHCSTPDDSPLWGRAEPPSQLQHHINYYYTSTLSIDDSFQGATAEDEEDFPTVPLDDNIWLENPVPDRHLCIHEQVTTTLPVFLSLSIQLGSATPHSRRCTSTILWDNGPQWHLRSPRCDDNHQ